MPILVVASPKGGVGKSTLAANLAVALQRRGRQVTAVDFDSQNALRFLLLPDGPPGLGIADCVVQGLPWMDAVQTGPTGVRLAPFGLSSNASRQHMKQLLTQERLAEALRGLAASPSDILLVDTAPGGGRFQERLEQVADLELIVLLADAGSMSLVPGFRDGMLLQPADNVTYAVLNQVDPRRRLSRDISEFVSQYAGDRFIGAVHYDEALAEAAAHGLPVLQAAPDSLAAKDINDLASRLDVLLSNTNH
jgi:cellulose synthase operon protein YhjQ